MGVFMSKYLERISQGLCGRCGKPSSTRSCNKCRKKVTAQNQRYKKNREKKGLCRHCKCVAIRGKYCTKHWLSARSSDYKKQYGLAMSDLIKLYERQSGRCGYSNVPITIGKNAELDHKIPKSKGGSNRLDNLHWVHKKINRMKGDLLQDEFVVLCKNVAACN